MASTREQAAADMTRAAYRVQPAETFVRVEIMDEQGLRAWSSPVRL